MTAWEDDFRGYLASAGGRLEPAAAVAIVEQAATLGTGATLTPSAPERRAGTDSGYPGPVDPRADIYELTGLLYECLVGHPPFPADATVTELRNAPPPRPTISNPAVSPVFDEVVARGLAADPNLRYQTVPELLTACQSALGTGAPAVPYYSNWTGPAPLPPAPRSPVVPVLVALLVVLLVGGYGLLGFLTRHTWLRGEPRPGVTAVLAASTPDGAPVSAGALNQTRDIVSNRLAALGTTGAEVTVVGSDLTITMPGDEDAVRAVTAAGQLQLRPVVRAIPVGGIVAGQSTPATAPPAGPDKNRIAFEKQLRQSKQQNLLMLLAIPYVAAHCGQPDPLSGYDDPQLSLVTCSQDGQTVYLLAPAIIGGQQLSHVSSGFSEQTGQHVIDLQFNPDASQRWANFTAANIGSQVAFTMDTVVLSAPAIREPIPGGKTQISGYFSAQQARQLAAVLQTQPLPVVLSLQSSTPKTVAGQEGSTQARLLMVGAGTFVALTAIAGMTYLGMRRYRKPAQPVFAPQTPYI